MEPALKNGNALKKPLENGHSAHSTSSGQASLIASTKTSAPALVETCECCGSLIFGRFPVEN